MESIALAAGYRRHQFHPYIPPTKTYPALTSGSDYTPLSTEQSSSPTVQPVSHSSDFSQPAAMPSSVPADLTTGNNQYSPDDHYNAYLREMHAAELRIKLEQEQSQAYFEKLNEQNRRDDLEASIRYDRMRKETDSVLDELHRSSPDYNTVNSPDYNSYNSGTVVNPNDVRVNGYYRSNGTYVAPYHRSAPNSTTSDNYSTYGNTNPYTGQAGRRH